MLALRTRANEVHVTAQDVPKLGNLIDSSLANNASDPSSAIIAFDSPYWTILFGVNTHRTKLYQDKVATVFAHALLPIKHRAVRVQLDQNCCQDKERDGQDCSDQ